MLSKSKPPKVFISYSWEESEHQNWVRKLATKLRKNGIDTTLDQWHAVPGDRLPKFMEESITKHDYILVVCTPTYKKKSDNRTGGVGYEGDIITGELLKKRNHRKFIPLLRRGNEKTSLPIWLSGAKYIDFREGAFANNAIANMVSILLGRSKLPPIRPIPPYLPVHQGKKWVVAFSSGSGYENQILLTDVEFPVVKIEQKSELGYFVTSVSYGEGKWNVILSKGSQLVKQSIHLSKSFPYRTINNNAKKNYKITGLSYGQGQWVAVLSKGERHIKQSWALRDKLSKRFIEKKWDKKYKGNEHVITNLSYGGGKWALVVSKGYDDSGCGWAYGPDFPKDYIEKMKSYVTYLSYGNGVW